MSNKTKYALIVTLLVVGYAKSYPSTSWVEASALLAPTYLFFYFIQKVKWYN
jgi:hypothetical protein